MSLTSTKASTQDNSSGTPVACGVNEDDASKNLQAAVLVGNKSTFAEVSRTALTTADAPTGGDMTTTGFAGSAGANLSSCGNALSALVRATCGTASAALTGRLAFYDSSNNCLGYSELIQFTADPTLRLGNASGDFISQRQIIDFSSAQKFRFFVVSITAGTWAVYVRPI